MNVKEKYRYLCEIEPSIPVFSKDWWLDAVVGKDNWDVILVEKGGRVIASFPYFIKKKAIFKYITMPNLTQTAGVWIKYPSGQKYTTKLAFEKQIMESIIEKIPKIDYFNQNFHYTFKNWLPFYWHDFKQTTKYTYVLECLEDLDNIFGEFRENIKREIRKAEKKVRIEKNLPIEDFYEINKQTFKRQNKEIPYTLDLIRKLDEICKEKNCSLILYAVDEYEQIHSAIYLIWDDESMYYLMGGGNPELRNSGATSLLMWEAIKIAAAMGRKFDFEGSMIEPIEKFFRGFGAVQKPYFNISKTNSKLLKVYDFIREVRK